MRDVPALRVVDENRAPLHPNRSYVLYWMTAARRAHSNFALDHAISHARTLRKPLVVFEPLRLDYPWASDRFHHFVIDGMRDNADAFASAPVTYLPYVEQKANDARGLLQTLAAQACVVVTDYFPCFFLPHMLTAAAKKLDVKLESVDTNGLVPLRAVDRTFHRAMDFRRWCQKNILPHLQNAPEKKPLEKLWLPRLETLPKTVSSRWTFADAKLLAHERSLDTLPIDHDVSPVEYRGGAHAGTAVVARFIERRLERYLDRNHPDEDVASGLSPYLHFGHVSVHDVFSAIVDHESWTPARASTKADGKNHGFWGMSAAAESFLEELIVWREIGYVFCHRESAFDTYESLPPWALESLAKHAHDKRPYVYDLPAFEQARTHDPLWNAAQRQLVKEGRIHNYLRMLWGKKILEWSGTPQQALQTLIHLNNKYAVDGRNPNSYCGIFWCLGRFDRPWPEREIYGVIRSMSSDSTKKKVELDAYLRKFGSEDSRQLDIFSR